MFFIEIMSFSKEVKSNLTVIMINIFLLMVISYEKKTCLSSFKFS